MKAGAVLLICVVMLVGCNAADDAPTTTGATSTDGSPTATTGTTVVGPGTSLAPGSGSGGTAAPPDLSRLPLGDGRVSNAPTAGSVFSCQQRFPANAQGAFREGPWIRPDGTFDLTAKVTVDGAVPWPGRFEAAVKSEVRLVTSNGVPLGHPAGQFPVEPADDAYGFDRNPNSVAERDNTWTLPANPVPADAPTCVPMGPIGVTVSGVVFFNALDARGRDAVAHEIQDACDGHPEQANEYHYHSITDCIADPGTDHSGLVGYAFDGFGLFGKRGVDGKPVTNADLDECHGHTHRMAWDGKDEEQYHYHATWEYPYTVACYRGTPLR